jgi:predicted membrane channel-forming protein YqfA (hemolysin III family)
MKSHLGLMLIFSVLVALVFTFIAKNGVKERIKYFIYLLGSFVLLSLLAAWLMYPFPW